jgi:hypothetical protein
MGRTYFWRVAETAPCGAALGPTWSFRTIPCRITKVKKVGSPFRLKVKGEGFRFNHEILIDGVPVPKTTFKYEGKLVAKKGNALKEMVPKGRTVWITVVDPKGGISEAFEFRR